MCAFAFFPIHGSGATHTVNIFIIIIIISVYLCTRQSKMCGKTQQYRPKIMMVVNMMVSDIVEKTLCCAWNVACLYLSSDGEHKLDSIKYLRNAYVRLFGTMAIRIQHLTNYSFKPYFSYIELIIYPVWLATSSSTFQSNYTTYMYSLPDTICFAGKSQKECHQLLCLKKFQKCVIGPPQKIATLHHRKGHLIEWKSGFYKMGSSSAQSLS